MNPVYAQAGWSQNAGCTGTSPLPLLVMVDACGDGNAEAANEYFMFQTGTSSYNVNSPGTSLTVACPPGTINSQVTSFTSSPASVAGLNALVGACASGNVFVDAMAAPPAGVSGVIPPNAQVLAFTTTFPDLSIFPPNYFASLCGASPIYVIFGNYPGPLPMFKNFGCTGCGCFRYITLSFGGCTYSITYDVEQLVTAAGVPGTANGSFITMDPGGVIGYGNENNECIPVATFCTPPAAPVFTVTNQAICSGQPAPAFTCSNCDAATEWYGSEFGSTLIATGTSYTPSPTPATTTTYWVQNVADCNSDRTPVTLTINPNPTVSVSIPGGFTYCQGQSFSLNASGSSNTGASPTYNWTISGPAGTVTASGVTPSVSITNPGTYSINLVITNTTNSCSNSATYNNILTITAASAVVIDVPPPSSICNTAAPVTLTTTQSGIAGTWSGSGVSGNQFNPAGLSGNIVLTFTPTAGLCALPNTATVSVTAPVAAVIGTPPPATICNTAAPVALATTQSGITGTWSGSGVSGNQFNPAGLSGNIVLTFTPTAGLCALPNTATVTVTAPAAVVIGTPPPATICNTAAPVALTTTQSGITGTWSGSGVTGNQFNPAGLSGNIVLTFTPAAGQCSLPNTATVSVTVAAPVVISTAPPAVVCNTSALISLAAVQSGTNGIWSGTGVSGNQFNPAGLSGNVILTFTPTAGICALANTATVTVTVATAVIISNPPPASICNIASPIALNTTQSGISGNWTGTGVSGNQFNPAGLSGNIVLAFTPTAGQCALAGNTVINVTAAAAVTISAPPASPVCSTDSPLALNPTQSGISGTWSGAGVSGNQFDPSGQSGSVVLTFTPAAGNCALPNTTTITVTTATAIAISTPPASPVCSTDAPIALNPTQSGVAGTWSGAGVSGNQFDPSGQNGSVVLTFTPAAGNCALPNTTSVTVTTATAIAISTPPASPVCSTDAPIALNPTQSGVAGTWSGPGITGNQFNPSGIVAPSVTLTFTPNIGQCALSATATVVVNQASAVTVTNPPPASLCSLDAPVNLNSVQSGVSGVWSGNGVSGNVFNPSGIAAPSVTLTFTPNAGQCVLPNTATIVINTALPVTITAPPAGNFCTLDAPVLLAVTQSGITGSWIGSGVSGGNQFNPAGLSGNIVLTFTPAAGQCALENTETVNVTGAAPVSVSNPPPGVLCNTGTPVTLNSSQSGVSGIWSGTGVSGGNTFNPAGLNGNIVLTFTPAAGQCSLSNTANVNVSNAVPVSLSDPPPASVCENATAVTLNTTQNGISGTWSGAGVSGNLWLPTGLQGIVILTFTPAAGQCALENTASVNVVAAPDAGTIIPPVAQLCNNNLPGNITTLDLNALVSGNTGGFWTTDAPAGTVSAGNIFNATGLPDNATYTVTYTVAGVAPCAAESTSQIIGVINCAANCTENATITAPPALCGAAGNTLDLNTLLVAGVTTNGGTWTTNAPAGTLSGSVFSASGLNGSYTVTYTVTGAPGCPNLSSTQNINLVAPPNAATTAPAGALCNAVASPVLNLALLVTGNAGGIWSCPAAPGAISGNTFNASGLAAGTYQVVYTVNAIAPCATNASTTQTITVADNTTTAGPDDSICGLTYTLNGFSDYSGTWTLVAAPTALASATFANPNLAQTDVTVSETGTYTFAWNPIGDPCTTQDVVTIAFTDAPSANAGPDATACGLTYTLAANGTGTWTYSGAGTVVFDNANNPTATVTVPAAGIYQFSWTSGAGACAATDAVQVTFINPLQVSTAINCSADLSNFTVVLNIAGGTPPYFVNGLPVAGSVYTGTFINNANYSLLVDDSGVCASLLESGTQNCACPAVADPVLLPYTDTVCQGVPLPQISVTPSATDVYNWYASPPGASTFISTGNTFAPPAAGSYAVQAVAPNGCVSAFVAFDITALPQPPTPLLNATYDFCTGTPVPVLATAATAGATLQWTGAETGSGTEFQPLVTASGNYAYTVTEISAQGCSSQPVALTLNLADCTCPAVATITPNQVSCSGDAVNLTATLTSNLNLDHVEWLAPDGSLIGSNLAVSVSETITACTPQVLDYTLNVYCSDNPLVPSSSQTVSVTWYPIPDAVLSLSPDGCSITATPNCPQFLVSPNTTQSTTVNGSTNAVTFTVINNDAALLGLPCSFTNITGNYNCVISSCPFIAGLAPGSQTQVCSGSSYNLILDVTDFVTLADVEWAVNGTFAGGGQNIALTAPTVTGCTAQTVQVTASIYCTNDPSAVWDSETFDITVFPAFDPALLTFTPDCSNLPTLTSACTNYVLAPVNVPVPVPGTNTATWSVSYNGSTCIDETATYTYTCSGCPVADVPLSASLPVCDGDIPDWSALEAQIGITDADGTANGFAWFSDAALANPLTPADYAHSGACAAETFTLYVAVLCTAGNPVPAGTLTLTVFPQPVTVTPAGGCSLQVQDNCGNLLIIEYLQTDGTWSGNVPNPAPTMGETAQWRAYVAGAPDANADGAPDCMQTGTVMAVCACTPPLPPVGVVTDVAVCAGEVNATAFEATTVAGTYVIWIDATTGLPIADGTTFTATTPGTYFAQAVLDDNDLCTSTQVAFTLTGLPTENANFTYAGSQFCIGDPAALPTITGTPGGTFSASGGVNIDPVSGSIDFTIAGSFVVTYTTPGICSDTGTFNLSVIDCTTCTPPAAPVLITGLLSICEGSTNSAAFEVTTQPNTFVQWFDSNNNPIDTGNTFVPLLPGSYFAQAVETGNVLCVSTQVTAILEELPQEDATFTYPSTSFCTGTANPVPVINGTPGGTFSTTNGLTVNALTGEIDLASVPAGGNFDIIYTTGGICAGSDTVAITITTSGINADAGPDITICEGNVAELSGLVLSGIAGTVNWTATPGVGNFSNATSLSGDFTPLVTGNITLYLQVTDACANTAIDSLLLTVQPQVVISVSGDATIAAGQNTQLTATGATNYLWQPGTGLSCTDCSNPIAAPVETTTYVVSTADACSEPVSFTVIVTPAGEKLLVPNAFSPNNDGENDRFNIFSSQPLNSFILRIYNRWGNLIFETTKPDEGWDGTFKGKEQEIGVYVYAIQYSFADGFEQYKKGNITLVR
ncbi:hypothetical protein BVG80_01765 [Sphingobacteriales bacterium TSM_CSM]|nr:hypothetical protein BVG80_01765 [Sphingobacteriales bacterium TSM_CSM]